jgi:uncharacterized protein
MLTKRAHVRWIWLAVLIASLWLAGCNFPGTPDAAGAQAGINPGNPQEVSQTSGELPPPAVWTPSPTATQIASSTPDATSTPTITPSATPTATPTLHPMAIERLRATPHPGSEIVITETLENGANYHRYIAYYLSEGLRIYGLLTVPFGDPPPGGFPAIVFNHGYIPPAQYRATERYIAYVDNLARSGYIVYRIDYRGHDRSDGLPTGAYGDPGYTVDVLNAVGALKQFPLADPARIGMWGHSMGGFLTLRAMVISQEIRAGVIWAGVVASYPDMLTHWRRSAGFVTPTPGPFTTTRGWRTGWSQLYGSPEENPAFWHSVSANSYVSEISGPLQLHHGTADASVPLMLSELLYDELQAAGKTVELHTYAGDDHNLAGSFSLAMRRTIEFYHQYLRDAP